MVNPQTQLGSSADVADEALLARVFAQNDAAVSALATWRSLANQELAPGGLGVGGRWLGLGHSRQLIEPTAQCLASSLLRLWRRSGGPLLSSTVFRALLPLRVL